MQRLITLILAVSFIGNSIGPHARPAMAHNPASHTFGQTGDKLAAANQVYQEARSLFNQNTQESLQAARNKFKEARQLYHDAGDKRGGANSLFYLGRISQNAGETSAAMENYQQAATLYQSINDKEWEAQTLLEIGILYSSMKKYKQALETDRRALMLFRQVKDKLGEAAAFIYLGVDYKDLADKEQAAAHYQLALTIYREIKDKEQEADTLTRLADLYTDSDKVSDALKHYANALTLYRELNNLSKIAETLNDVGRTYFILGEKEKALPLFKEALAIYESLKDKNGEAKSLLGIGTIYNAMILPEKALSYLERALKIYQELGDRTEAAAILLTLSGIYTSLGEQEKAADYSKQATAIIQRDAAKESAVLAPLVSIMTMGISSDDEDEDEMMERIKEVFSHSDRQLSRLKDEAADDYIMRLITASLYHFFSKEPQKALEYLGRATETARAENNQQAEALTLFFTALIQGYLKQPAAIINLQRVADISHSFGYKDMETASIFFVGMLYSEWYKEEETPEKKAEYFAQALKYLNHAVIAYQAANDKNLEGNLLMMLMEMWRDENNPQMAILYGKRAVNLFQSVRSELQDLDKKLQDSYLERVVDAYQTLADILIAQGRIAEAEQVLAMLKEEEFFEYVRRDDKVAKELLGRLSLTPAEREAFQRYEAIANDLTRIGRELSDLRAESQRFPAGKFPKQARLDALEKQLADANKVFNAFLDDLKTKFGEKDNRVAEVESGTQALLKALKQPHTVIISTIAGQERLNLIVTTSDAQRAHTVDIKAADLNLLVYQFREAVKNPKVDPRPAGKRLYDVLFPAALQKDLDGIKADTIIWSLDGTLRYVPVAALWDGEKYLVERYANSVITLASRDKLNQPREFKKRSALGLGVSKPFGSFSALPGVPEELCRVINDPQTAARCAERKSGVISGRRLLDEEFTLPMFKAHLGRYPLIHIASHFSLNPGNEADSYLLLGGGKTDDERKLNLNTIRENMKTAFVGVELLTLSACNTAMTAGAKSNGLEVEGFGALAQKQGAKSVLASLWAVADPSTRDLMTEFYRMLETDQQLGKAETLRRAQLSLLRGTYRPVESPLWRRGSDIIGTNNDASFFKEDPNAPFAHPYYWSPFVLFGNWR
jgi:Uncharacterized protein conserved in bacteria